MVMKIKETLTLALLCMSLLPMKAQVEQTVEATEQTAVPAAQTTVPAAQTASPVVQNVDSTTQTTEPTTESVIGGFDFGKHKTASEAEAERAQKAAQEAAEKAAAARKEAAKKSTLNLEEVKRIAQEQERQKELARQKRDAKLNLRPETKEDSLKWVENQRRLREWTYTWALGGQLAVNWFVADNVTDHPPFRWFSDAINLGFTAYGVRYFNRIVGVRLGMGYHTFANRVDRETVDEMWRHNWAKKGETEPFVIYDGNGFYSMGVWDLYADALFDVGGIKTSPRYHSLHVYATAGLGMLFSGKKELRTGLREDMFERYYDEKQERTRLRLKDGHGVAEAFETRVDPDASAALAIRFGLLFDYRVSRHLSANLELNVNVTTNDGIDGITYAEPFDIPIKIAGGVMYHF